MREQFEAWIVERGYRTPEEIADERESDPNYFTVLMTTLWAGWQSAHTSCPQSEKP